MIAISAISTIIVLVVFLAIIFWAWSGKRKADFDEAARIPLEDGKDQDDEN